MSETASSSDMPVFCARRGAQVLDHCLHRGVVGVLAVVVAPLAVMIGRGARGIGAAVAGREYHAAALAIVLGHFEQVRQGLAGHGGNELHHVDARCDLAAFPTADGLACDEELAASCSWVR